jgi:flagellar biosynthesis chaperone FliJ
MSESKKYKLIFQKLIKISDKNFNEGGLSTKDNNEYNKLSNELNEHQYKLIDKFWSNYKGKIDNKIFSKIIDGIAGNKIFSLDEIPELNKDKKETIKKPSSTLAKLKEEVDELIPELTSKQKKLIVKIPHDTYTAKNIYQIIKYIHSGKITNENEFPEPGRGKKANLEDLSIFNKLTLAEGWYKSA